MLFTTKTANNPQTSNDLSTGISGMVISIVYGSCQLVLLLILSIIIYVQSIKKGDKLSFKHFVIAIWKERGVYSPVLIHIYDTATDVGVLYEWYKLAEIEKNGTNLESLDMQRFFWTAIGLMIAYRFLLGCAGFYFVYFVTDKYKKNDRRVFAEEKSKTERVFIALGGFYWIHFIGFILGALELVVFMGIFLDYKEKKGRQNPERGAGENQKACQSSEGVLESLPEVIMQSVFYMRAINDPVLNEVSGDIFILVAFSIAASVLSITSKYVWVDEYMVKNSTKSLVIKEDNEHNDGVLMGYCCCIKGYNISYGYIVRVTWRLAAVTARFVIIALIWVVLGGAVELVMIPSMIVIWYILLFFFAIRGKCCDCVKEFRKEWKEIVSAFYDECGGRCLLIFILGFCAVLLVGAVLQLGIAVVSGAGVYVIRIIENFMLMTVITVFAAVSFDCYKCADPTQRLAFGHDSNQRILLWIIVGWTSVIVHAIMSCLMPIIIDYEYEFNLQAVSEMYWGQEHVGRLTEEEYYLRRKTCTNKLQKTVKIQSDKVPICECGKKFVPMEAQYCYPGQYTITCLYDEGCAELYGGKEILWQCPKSVDDMWDRTRAAEQDPESDFDYGSHDLAPFEYALCSNCVIKPHHDKIKLKMKEWMSVGSPSEFVAPICICGKMMAPTCIELEGGGDERFRCWAKRCNNKRNRVFWYCKNKNATEHGDDYRLCIECGSKATNKYNNFDFEKSNSDVMELEEKDAEMRTATIDINPDDDCL